ncbi:retrovirus-related pol polyprotein from transposon TNT 1-94 [Tanacetum coccineum]
MSSMQEDIQCAGSDTRPPMLDRTDFESWQQRIRLYCLGKDNGENIMKSIKEGPFHMGTVSDVIAGGTEGAVQQGPVRARVLNDLSAEEKERYKADIRATNILLQGIPKDIYSLINHYTDAKDIWENVKMILEGSELTKDDRESQLYDEFEHFRQIKGETIQGYYVRFTKLINDMRNIKMTMPRMQLNSKFVNNMLPEWSRFITEVKLNRGLKESNFDQSVEDRNEEDMINPGQQKPIKCYNCIDNGPRANCMLIVQGQSDFKISDYFKDQDATMLSQGEWSSTGMKNSLLFLAASPSEDPIYDEAGTSYDSNMIHLRVNDYHWKQACRTGHALVSGLATHKHMTGNRSKLMYFVGEKSSGQSDWECSLRSYHVGIFCDTDLEVAFRKHTCFVRDINGIDILKGSRSTNLYTISMDKLMKSSPICLLSKASKSKSLLWHGRLNHLNFSTINDLAQKDLVRGLPRLKFENDHLCSPLSTWNKKKFSTDQNLENTNMEFFIPSKDLVRSNESLRASKGNNYILVIMDDLFMIQWVGLPNSQFICTDNGTEFVQPEFLSAIHMKESGYSHQKSVRDLLKPKNGVVERRNRTWVSPSRKGYRMYNKRTRRLMETIHVTFDEMHQSMAPVRISSGPVPVIMTPGQLKSGLLQPTKSWKMLFQPMYIFVYTTIAQETVNKFSSSTSDIHLPVQHQEIIEEPIPEDTPIIHDRNPTKLTTLLIYQEMDPKDNPMDHTSLETPLVAVINRNSLASDALGIVSILNCPKVEPRKELQNWPVIEDCWFQAMQDEIQTLIHLKLMGSSTAQSIPGKSTHVYRLKKALLWAKAALEERGIDTLSKFLMDKQFHHGQRPCLLNAYADADHAAEVKIQKEYVGHAYAQFSW